MATWDEWSSAYEAAYLALPEDLNVPCPNCGHRCLRLVFTGHLDRGVGYASFWCDNCLQGIVVSRAPIPAGSVTRSIDEAPDDRLPRIPNYQVVS
ncbi:hypothetical protein ACFFWC_28070 [Plantactinospora siamensis]|uniref:Uncharacterized protein n=1 Tax=Plantactinospora siamensis TaxID=555372 RepID=A0ABV6NQ50_9ACTN